MPTRMVKLISLSLQNASTIQLKILVSMQLCYLPTSQNTCLMIPGQFISFQLISLCDLTKKYIRNLFLIFYWSRELLVVEPYLELSCHYLSQPVTTHHYLSPSVTTRHRLSLSVTTHHYLSPSFTTCHYMSLPVTSCHYLSPSVTACHYLSLPVTTCHYSNSNLNSSFTAFLIFSVH